MPGRDSHGCELVVLGLRKSKGLIVDAVEPQIRQLLAAWPEAKGLVERANRYR